VNKENKTKQKKVLVEETGGLVKIKHAGMTGKISLSAVFQSLTVGRYK